MARFALDLTWDECSRWLLDLGWERDGKPDWERLLKRAGVKSHKDTIKNRWKQDKSPRDRAKIRAELERLEREKGGTPYGIALGDLEEWLNIGRELALKRTRAFEGQLIRLQELVADVNLMNTRSEAEARIAEAEAPALTSITPAKKVEGDRKPLKSAPGLHSGPRAQK